jgi:hypothetical protein
VKKIYFIALGMAVLYVALLGGLWGVMHRPILFGQVMRHVPDPAFLVIPFRQLWFSARAGSLKVGDPAPDFNLPTSDKKTYVRLSSLRGSKPVVLIFGSYT